MLIMQVGLRSQVDLRPTLFYILLSSWNLHGQYSLINPWLHYVSTSKNFQDKGKKSPHFWAKIQLFKKFFEKIGNIIRWAQAVSFCTGGVRFGGLRGNGNLRVPRRPSTSSQENRRFLRYNGWDCRSRFAPSQWHFLLHASWESGEVLAMTFFLLEISNWQFGFYRAV